MPSWPTSAPPTPGSSTAPTSTRSPISPARCSTTGFKPCVPRSSRGSRPSLEVVAADDPRRAELPRRGVLRSLADRRRRRRVGCAPRGLGVGGARHTCAPRPHRRPHEPGRAGGQPRRGDPARHRSPPPSLPPPATRSGSPSSGSRSCCSARWSATHRPLRRPSAGRSTPSRRAIRSCRAGPATPPAKCWPPTIPSAPAVTSTPPSSWPRRAAAGSSRVSPASRRRRSRPATETHVEPLPRYRELLELWQTRLTRADRRDDHARRGGGARIARRSRDGGDPPRWRGGERQLRRRSVPTRTARRR